MPVHDDFSYYYRGGITHSPLTTDELLRSYIARVGLGAADRNNPRVKAIIAVMADLLKLERMTPELWDEYALKLTNLQEFECSLTRYLGERPTEGNADVRE